ncbi:hypothetical protein JXJ21_19790 [candidate division KSB1 bacterium]|nr:hypothetical protein [candidate division KSB1 bacterium]
MRVFLTREINDRCKAIFDQVFSVRTIPLLNEGAADINAASRTNSVRQRQLLATELDRPVP